MASKRVFTDELSELSDQQEQLIFALLRSKTKQAAAYACGVPARTMYNWLRNQNFRSAFRAAQRAQFNEALGTLERGSGRAAELLVDAMEGGVSENVINVCKAIIDRAFKAQDAITVQEELDDLRALLASYKKPAPVVAKAPVPPADVPKMVTDNTEAYRLRVEWMALLPNDPQDVADSLRYNPPQSIAEEQELLECVRAMLAQEKLEADLLEQAKAEAGNHE